MTRGEEFEELRPLLFAIAYRILGSVAVAEDAVMSAYEDVYYYLWRERRLPTNVDPFDAKLDDELERDRLRKIFSQGLEATVGYALPLTRATGTTAWRTGPWFLRAERLYLMPGDSAMGYRLPLDSLPWVSALEYPYLAEFDPMEPRPPLPSAEMLRARFTGAVAPLQQVADFEASSSGLAGAKAPLQ